MAYDVTVREARIKVRNPYGVACLNLVTLGIYGVLWYYRTNQALRAFGDAYRDDELAASKPVRSLLAMSLGLLLVVPPVVSLTRFVGRVRRAERIGRSELTSGWLIVLMMLTLLLGFAVPGYVQSNLTVLWRRYPRRIRPSAVGADAVAAPAPGPASAALSQTPPPTPWPLLGGRLSRSAARFWFWLRGPDPAVRAPRDWLFKPVIGVLALAAIVGVPFLPMPGPILALVILAALAVAVHNDRRAQRLPPFWWSSAAGTFGPLGFLAYCRARRQTLELTGRPVPAGEPIPPYPVGLYDGWYPDPLGEGRLRWWSGGRWTEDTAP